MVLLVIMKLTIGDVEGMISLCIPYFLMEPIIDRLSSQQWFVSHSRKSEGVKDLIQKTLDHVKVPMAMELGHTILSLADVYGIEVGDVIKLDEPFDGDISVRVGNRIRFKAKPGTVEGRLAGEVTEVVSMSASDDPEGGEN